MIKVLELRDYASYRALCAYGKLVWGMKMVPGFLNLSLGQFEDEYLNSLSLDELTKHFQHGAELVTLERDEVEDLICFCTDANGVKYSRENMRNLGPVEIRNLVAAVALEIFKIKVDSISAEQKKSSKTAP